MSIINEALKKTQTNLNDLKEKTVTVTDDRISVGQKAWQSHAAQPAQPFTPAPSSAPAATPAPQAKRTSTKRWHLIVIAEILVLGLAAWILFIFQPQLFRSSLHPKRSPAARKSITTTAQPKPEASLPQPVPAASASLAPSQRLLPLGGPMAAGREPPAEIKFSVGAPAKNLVLNGIMMDQSKMAALINGEIYEVGDYIAGQRINKITLNRVELRDGDNVTILEVREQGR
ncbi:MAG: hypothetical protein HY210_05050 [Candidatus Omnitrophica bacterium]|nr:hypothetical protein [Candidatus Omnitrophota bacterium]